MRRTSTTKTGKADPVILISKLFEDHYKPTRLRGGHNTVRLYRCLLCRLSDHYGRHSTTRDFENVSISRFLDRRSSQVSPHTVERERTQVLALWRFAFVHRLGGVVTMPDVPAGRLPEKIPRAWTVDQMRMLMISARMTPGQIAGKEAGNFFHALIFCAWITGERIGAIMALVPGDLVDPHLFIRGETRKGGRSSKVFELPDELVALLHNIEGRSKIFEWDRSDTLLWSYFKRIAKRANLYEKGVGFHQIRRSSASYVAANGGDPSEHLGHSNPELAKKHYLDPRITEAGKDPTYKLLPRIL
jgi:integrase